MSKKIDTLQLFFEEPNRWFHVREVAKLLQVNPMTAAKYLALASKENLLLSKRERGFLFYRANEGSVVFKEHKKHYNVLKLANSGLIEFLNAELAYPAIILFGSYAKGEDFEKSDVDLFILSNTKKELDLGKYEKLIKRKIQLFLMNDKEFDALKTKNPELANNIINGINISGFLKVF